MMMHHHTKFDYKWVSGLEDIVWTNPVTQTDKQTQWFHYTPITLLQGGIIITSLILFLHTHIHLHNESRVTAKQ